LAIPKVEGINPNKEGLGKQDFLLLPIIIIKFQLIPTNLRLAFGNLSLITNQVRLGDFRLEPKGKILEVIPSQEFTH